MRRHDNAPQKGNDALSVTVAGPAEAGLGFHPPLTTCESMAGAPMLHTVQPLPTCGTTTPAPPAGQPSCAVDRTAPTGSSSSHRVGLLHCWPRLIAPSQPPATAHASSRQASLHYRQLRLLAPCRPPLPLARASMRRAGLRALLPLLPRRPNAVCHASPASRPWPSRGKTTQGEAVNRTCFLDNV
ncbi:hypothetical protein OsI_10200 [Oryza sativa Indica Group]|uniref:Uncharacterized protein n=1 Tax=Oryza sativa subsp. indica TaxID=39946 RepID=B8APB6_ORYSI|nr:hypothetical protein OsI_10200 [Oryza sativa Indica Group]